MKVVCRGEELDGNYIIFLFKERMYIWWDWKFFVVLDCRMLLNWFVEICIVLFFCVISLSNRGYIIISILGWEGLLSNFKWVGLV